MMANPKIGQLVRIHYNKRIAHTMPLHGRIGRVVVVSKGKPRNHGVTVDYKLYVVPCGNLVKVDNIDGLDAFNSFETMAELARQCIERTQGESVTSEPEQLDLF